MFGIELEELPNVKLTHPPFPPQTFSHLLRSAPLPRKWPGDRYVPKKVNPRNNEF